MRQRRGRFPRPVYLAVLALVLIVGGCWAVGTASTIASGPTNGYDYSRQGEPVTGGGQVQAPMVGPLPQPGPRTPTWTGTLRVTAEGVNMSYQPPAIDTVGGTATAVTPGVTDRLLSGSAVGASGYRATPSVRAESCPLGSS